ncbi:phage/plasmid-related protein TIGR03299 [Synechococcus sp. WH 8016]|nr:phage/plasmid-related protein TIGR03299 [Synechococcus sp. WH 8016]
MAVYIRVLTRDVSTYLLHMSETLREMNSGWLLKADGSQFNSGVITDHSLPAREAFETAGALFTVSKHPLFFKDAIGQEHESNGVGLVRQDTGRELGVVTANYEVVQNDRLLEMAEALRDEVSMETVVLIQHGAKVAFTAQIKGTNSDVVPGDTVGKRIVGYLGHDGKTGIGALFTTVRVVCSNTLALATAKASDLKRLTHKGGANADVTTLIESINVARESFDQEVEGLKLLANTPMTNDLCREFLERVFAKEIAGQIKKDKDAPARDKTLEDLRITKHIYRAVNNGLGHQYAPNTLYSAFNAVTEVLTSPLTGRGESKLGSLWFGVNRNRVEAVREIALELATA